MKIQYGDSVRGENIGKFLSGKANLKRLKVLDIGCNNGAISTGIARTAKYVVSGEIEKKRLRKFAQRNKQRNTSMLVMDGLSPPFKCSSFDLVIINGVMEHVPLTRRGNPKNIQINFLRDVNRLLKRNGIVYIGIENRFSIKYLTGAKSHNDMRFIDFLPRGIANAYAKTIKGGEFRQYTHGIGVYEKMLLDAGFSDIKFHMAIPNYQFPEQIIKINDKNSLMGGMDKSVDKLIYRIGGKIMVSLGLQKRLSTNFVILARK